MTVGYDEAVKLMSKHGQDHVFMFWDKLNGMQRSNLLSQIDSLDFTGIEKMRTILSSNECAVSNLEIEPAEVIGADKARIEEVVRTGENIIKTGKAGVLLVAGGQGSRLGFDGPKGAFGLAPITNGTLFEIHSRKILGLERKYGCEIPFYIMTSQANDTATRSFFKEHEYFGLSSDRVMFFKQGMWPALWKDGRIVMERADSLFMSPDGHGGILAALECNGMLNDMERRGLETLFYFQVDNPLVEILDPGFIGLHVNSKAEVSVKVCAKRDANEGLGVVVKRGGRNAIVEYIELTDEQKSAIGADGRLRLLYGSVAIHVFSFDFLKKEAGAGLPLHIACKKITYCDENGDIVQPAKPNAYKFEKFIFDVLPDAERVLNVEFARADEFSPVKNASGSDSPDTARKDMILKFARWFRECGLTVPVDETDQPLYRLEIDPCFALGPAELKKKLKSDFKITGDVLLT